MERNKKIKDIFYSAAYNYMGKLIATFLTFFSFILIVRILSVGDYAKYTFYLNAVFFVTLLLDFGLMEVALRYIPEYKEKHDFASIKGLLKAFSLIILSAALILILFIFLVRAAFVFLRVDFNLSAGILAGIVIFGCIRIVSLVFANILNAFFFQAYRITVEIIMAALRLMFIYLLLKSGLGVWYLISAYALLDLITSSILYMRIHGLLTRQKPSLDNKYFTRMFKFGINEYLYKLFWFFTDNRFDIYLAGLILGATKAGYFAFAASIVNLLTDWSPGFVIRPVISPLFISEYAARGDFNRIRYLFKLHNKFLIFIALPVFALMAILADKIIVYVFDPKYLPSLNTFLILICSMFFINIIIPLRNIISLVERPDISNISNVAAIPKIILIFLFAKAGGINALAWAYAFSLFLILWVNIVLLKKVIALDYPWVSFLKITVNTAAMGVVAYLSRPYIMGKISLFAALFVAAAIYLLAAYLNKAFEDEDREIFNRAFKIKLWHF